VGHAGDNGDNEKWIVESGDEPDIVTIQSFELA
jgi:hypothetical protein